MTEAGGERILAGLRRPVDEVRRPRTHSGDTRARRTSRGLDGATGGQRRGPTTGSDVVHLRQVRQRRPGRRGRVPQVDRRPGSRRRGRRSDQRGRRSVRRAVEARCVEVTATMSAAPNASASTSTSPGCRTARITRRNDGDTSRSTIARPMSLVPPRTRTVWGWSRALFMGGILSVEAGQHSSSRRAWSLTHTPPGSAAAHRPPLVEAGVPGRMASGVVWRPWPGSGGHRRRARVVEPVSSADRPRPAGTSTVSVHPGPGS